MRPRLGKYWVALNFRYVPYKRYKRVKEREYTCGVRVHRNLPYFSPTFISVAKVCDNVRVAMNFNDMCRNEYDPSSDVTRIVDHSY